MQKKLLAVAVAGALGAPAVALAQNATVTVYGKLYSEYGSVRQGATSPVSAPVAGTELVNVDILQNPGSALGFRGEEKLSGGLSTWFQCETSMDWRGVDKVGLCSRNSALGIKGGLGNFYVGNWQTPFYRAQDFIGTRETGVFGTANLMFGGATTVTGAASNRGLFDRRQNNLMTYDTPNLSGFQGMFAYTNMNTQTATLSASTGSKPRLYSAAVSYKNGPLNLSAGYEKHKDIAGAAAARSETGWSLTAGYSFADNVKVGGTYTRQTLESGTAALPTEGRVNVYHLGLDWKVSGPHSIRAGYTSAGDVSSRTGNLYAGVGALGASGYRPASDLSGSTGASLWQIRYAHTLSKRTEAAVGYVKLDNKTNAGYQLGGMSSSANGRDASAIALMLEHSF